MDELDKDLESYNSNLNSSNNVPAWFLDTMRTHATRNITLELWNTLSQNVKKIASDSKTQDTLLRALVNAIHALDGKTAEREWHHAYWDADMRILNFYNKDNVKLFEIELTLPEIVISVNCSNDFVLSFTILTSEFDDYGVVQKDVTVDLGTAMRELSVKDTDLNLVTGGRELAPPSTSAVVAYVGKVADTKLSKIPLQGVTSGICQVYCTDSMDGSPKLIPASVASLQTNNGLGTVVLRNEGGYVLVPDPKSGAHAVNLSYINNILSTDVYPVLNNLTNRIFDIEDVNNRILYDTEYIDADTPVQAFQVDNACSYGILTRLSGNVSYLKLGLPYNTAASSSVSSYTSNSYKIIAGKTTAYLYCPIAAETSIEVSMYSQGSIVHGRFGLATTTVSSAILKNTVGADTNGFFKANTRVTAKSAATYIFFDVPENNEVTDIRVMCYRTEDGYSGNAAISKGQMYAELRYDIPEAITRIQGYGDANSYIDFERKVFVSSTGVETDISGMLSSTSDMLNLEPSTIGRFYNANNAQVSASFRLYYKNRK